MIPNDRHYPLPPIPDDLSDGDLALRLEEIQAADAAKGWVAAYRFQMIEGGSGSVAGQVNLRLGDTPDLIRHGGHVGYRVEEPYRGRRYAARSVCLVLPLARAAGMEEIWITCDPENTASRRSIELAGGEYVDTLAILESSRMYAEGHRHVARYRFRLLPSTNDNS